METCLGVVGVVVGLIPWLHVSDLVSEQIGVIADLFAIEGTFVGAEEVETGLINSTWLASFDSGTVQACALYFAANQ